MNYESCQREIQNFIRFLDDKSLSYDNRNNSDNVCNQGAKRVSKT